MGFFKKVSKVFQKAVPAVATGGLSLLAPKSVQSTLGNILAPTSLKGVANVGLSVATGNPAGLVGGNTMGFNVGKFLGGASAVLSRSSSPYISGFGEMAGAFAPSYSMPSYGAPSVSQPIQATPVAMNLPVKRGPSLTKEIFDIGNKVLQKIGLPVAAEPGRWSAVMKRAIGALGSLARRTPSGTLISLLSGLGLTAYEATVLTGWYAQKKKRRRMNPANSKALKRSIRRVQSFHRLCTHADVLKSRSHRAPVHRKRHC